MARPSWAKIDVSTPASTHDRFHPPRRSDIDRWTIIAICACALLVTNTSTALIAWSVLDDRSSSGLAYSPANEAIEYMIHTFDSSSAQEPTIYLGPPNEEVDDAWENTYAQFQRTRIDAAEAMRLPNETASIINDPGYYLVTLDVFHQLHCLDFVRKRLYPSRYNTVSDLGLDRNGTRVSEIEHTEHCIDTIRQSLQCSADISPVLYHWDGYVGEVKGDARTVHRCRNFTKIQEWAAAHTVKQ